MEPSNETQQCRYTDETIKNKYVAKLLHPVKLNGFQSLRMDDIAKTMDLSKATLYKYFTSRDEIIEILVQLFTQYVVGAECQYDTGSAEDYFKGFKSSFAQTLLIANYGTETFFGDLREVYPQLMASIEVAISERNERLRRFYDQGIRDGIMYDTNTTLLIVQDELMFRHLLDPHYLMKHDLTLRGAIADYYQIKKRQLFRVEVYGQLDDSGMAERIEQLVRKVTYGVY
ncbi:TetR/AcrR family transcriptional regulator [Paenibacillus sacheonensis]|uniref:TetR family transcriptional regulator n=1 Tax=Paenibacillus sacheonensis TaxID=742054 RepID=A0A7X4YJZ3_9BACL|nr:TetR/AcrR family transcriptional regulator [Paenibacillus sacheonensis]MBM7563860.1 AcrR family transcriptional regulator [Paenibacillus sacheonensis]NBC67792.1 TetR family transcriptional regulator [Paenibacillus sacheonensis]